MDQNHRVEDRAEVRYVGNPCPRGKATSRSRDIAECPGTERGRPPSQPAFGICAYVPPASGKANLGDRRDEVGNKDRSGRTTACGTPWPEPHPSSADVPVWTLADTRAALGTLAGHRNRAGTAGKARRRQPHAGRSRRDRRLHRVASTERTADSRTDGDELRR